MQERSLPLLEAGRCWPSLGRAEGEAGAGAGAGFGRCVAEGAAPAVAPVPCGVLAAGWQRVPALPRLRERHVPRARQAATGLL